MNFTRFERYKHELSMDFLDDFEINVKVIKQCRMHVSAIQKELWRGDKEGEGRGYSLL